MVHPFAFAVACEIVQVAERDGPGVRWYVLDSCSPYHGSEYAAISFTSGRNGVTV